MPAGSKQKKQSVPNKLERNLRYLAQASQTLSSSLDYQTTLNKVAELAIPKVADWCAIDLINDQGQLELVAVAHQDPKQVKWALKLRQKYPIDLHEDQGLARVLRTGKAEMYPLITDDMLRATASTKEHLQLLRKMGFVSVIIVPISSGKKTIGGITFVSTQPELPYTKTDLTMAKELASRAALAITNARLYQEAQKAIKLRDDFISIASHELQTPLISMKMYTEVLQKRLEENEDIENLQYVQELHGQVKKVIKLIKDLLDVSRLQIQTVPLQIERFDMVKLIREVIVTVQLLPPWRDITFESKGPVWVWADRDRVSQVLLNLLTNAIKYSPASTRVVIRIKKVPKTIHVMIKDSGIGIAKKDQATIFNQFFQLKETGANTYTGLGIGLYIASEIVKRHQGTLTVTSRKGKGSTFTVQLPIKVPADKSH